MDSLVSDLLWKAEVDAFEAVAAFQYAMLSCSTDGEGEPAQ